MSWISIAAIYFILWWVVLFAMLPFGVRTQDDEGEVTPGTVASAPHGPHMRRAIIRTTLVASVVFAAFYIATVHYGFSFDDIPRIGPSAR